jgi:hypothetical protein
MSIQSNSFRDTKGMTMSLYEELKAAGIETDNHESDLYFPRTKDSEAILKRHPEQNGVVQTFTNQKPPHLGEIWFDVPFAFQPWWDARLTPKE